MSGMVEIRRGKGKLVEEKKIRKELNELRGLVEDMVELGRKKKENMIEKRQVKDCEEVEENIGVDVGKKVYRIESVRLEDGVEMQLEEKYLKIDIGEKIERKDLEVEKIF